LNAHRFVDFAESRDALLADLQSSTDYSLKFVRALPAAQLPQAELQGNDQISKLVHIQSE